MNALFRFGVFDKVKQAFSRGNSSAKSAAQADFLVKMHLAPLWGRRDAAFDEAVKLLGSDLFARDDSSRRKCYERIIEMLELSLNDTNAVILTLSSQDLSKRETRYRELQMMLRNLTEAAKYLITFEEVVREEESSLYRLLQDTASEHLDLTQDTFNSCELKIIHSALDLIDVTKARMKRYRSYAAKSFSQSNSKRYNRAYEEYKTYYAAKSEPCSTADVSL